MQALGLAWGDTQPQAHHEEIHTLLVEPIHRGARLLFDAWRRREAQSRFVVGRDVPSRELARVMSGLALFEPCGKQDFKVRLAGITLLRRFGRDVTGRTLSELFGEPHFHDHARQMQSLIATGHPFVLDVRSFERGRLAAHFELVALRVFAPDGFTPWVMSGIFYHDWRL